MKRITAALMALAMIFSLGVMTMAKPKRVKQNVTTQETGKLVIDIAKEDSIATCTFHETVVSYQGGQSVRVAHNGLILDRVFMDKEVARKYANIISYHRGLLHPVGMQFEDEAVKKALIQEANQKWGNDVPTTVDYMLPVYMLNEEAIRAYTFAPSWIESYK